jgi:hypothetical protein
MYRKSTGGGPRSGRTVHRGSAATRTGGRGSTLVGVRPPATPAHGSSSGRAKKREGSTWVLLRASLKLEWWCGDGATVMKWRRKRNSTAAAHKLGGWGKRRGEGVVRSGGSHLLFIEARGWCGEAATMVGV